MTTTLHLDILKDIRIASPCSAAWEDMAGDDKVRRCAQCDLNVHNLAEMTRAEIEQLVSGRRGRTCIRLYRRTDGTILTRDCPVGFAALRAKTRRTAARAVALLSVLCSASVLFAQGERSPWDKGKLITYQPFKWAQEALAPVAPIPLAGKMAMGDFAPPPLPIAPVTQGTPTFPGVPTP